MVFRSRLTVVLSLAIGAASLFAQSSVRPAIKRTLVRAGHVLDVKTGKVEPGKWADIIGVEQNPLNDIRTLGDVKFV